MEEKGLSIMDLLKILRRNIILIVSIVAIVTVIGFIYTFCLVSPKYKSSTKVIVMIDKTSTSGDAGAYDITTAQKMVDSVGEFLTDGLVTEAVLKDASVIEAAKNAGITINKKYIDSNRKVSSSTTKFFVSVSFESENKELSKVIANSIVEKAISIANDNVRIFKDTIIQTAKAEAGVYSSPNKTLYVFVSFAIGIVGAFIVIFLKEIINNTFTSKEDVTAKTGLEVVGLLPYSENDKDEKKRYELSDDTNAYYERLVLNMDYSAENGNVYQIASSVEKEGKTITACNVASLEAKRGKKVLLIDLDLRKPKIHRVFKIKNEVGVSDYVANKISIDEVINRNIKGIDIITAGTKAPFIMNILGSDRLKELLESVKGKYDYIIIDSAPVSVAGDAMQIAHLSDKILFVVSSRGVKRNVCADSLKQIKEAKGNVIGAFLTHVKKYDYTDYTYYSYSDKE